MRWKAKINCKTYKDSGFKTARQTTYKLWLLFCKISKLISLIAFPILKVTAETKTPYQSGITINDPQWSLSSIVSVPLETAIIAEELDPIENIINHDIQKHKKNVLKDDVPNIEENTITSDALNLMENMNLSEETKSIEITVKQKSSAPQTRSTIFPSPGNDSEFSSPTLPSLEEENTDLFYQSTRTLILTPGETTRLPLPTNHRVYVGQKDLLFLHSEGHSLIVSGKKEGQTFLRLKNKIHPVFIVKKELKQHILLVDQILQTCWGLNWSLDQHHIKITGRLNRLYDWIKLAKTAQQNNIPYLFHATLGEGLKEPAEKIFKKLFNSQSHNHISPLPNIQWQNLPLVLIPQGSKGTKEFYQKILQPFGLTTKTDPLWFAPASLIQIEVALFEITKNFSLAFGNPTTSSLRDLLNLLLSQGKGRLLHHSSLISQNEREMTIHSGGQIPFTQYNLETRQQTTRWKSHGLTLKITPQLDKEKTIRLKIRGEISSPSGSHPPSLKTQTFSGIFDVKERQILKLLHINKQSEGRAFNGSLSLLPPSAAANGQNYKMSRVIFLRASLLNHNASAIKKELTKK